MSASSRGLGEDGALHASEFYSVYHGHKKKHLHQLKSSATKERVEQHVDPSFIYLVGDSTLDNKYWLSHLPGSQVKPANGLANSFSPVGAYGIADVAHFVNTAIEASFSANRTTKNCAPYICINAAREESTLGERDGAKLFPQDQFVQQELTEKDVIVCSMGGNDVALKPGLRTIGSILTAIATAPYKETPVALGHFYNLFGAKTAAYLENLCKHRKPKLIVACMLYHLDANRNSPSWAGLTMQVLRYNSRPDLLQKIIELVYENGTKTIQVDGTKVVYLPFFKVLDGSDTRDYVQRVEPSVIGGKKMGEAIWKIVQENV